MRRINCRWLQLLMCLGSIVFLNPGGVLLGGGYDETVLPNMLSLKIDTDVQVMNQTRPAPCKACTETGVAIGMPKECFSAGDVYYVDVTVCNAGTSDLQGYPLFVVLEIPGGGYFFAPSFSPSLDYYDPEQIYSPGETIIHVVPSFYWPDSSGIMNGCVWYAGLTNPAMTDIFGELDTCSFSWNENRFNGHYTGYVDHGSTGEQREMSLEVNYNSFSGVMSFWAYPGAGEECSGDSYEVIFTGYTNSDGEIIDFYWANKPDDFGTYYWRGNMNGSFTPCSTPLEAQGVWSFEFGSNSPSDGWCEGWGGWHVTWVSP